MLQVSPLSLYPSSYFLFNLLSVFGGLSHRFTRPQFPVDFKLIFPDPISADPTTTWLHISFKFRRNLRNATSYLFSQLPQTKQNLLSISHLSRSILLFKSYIWDLLALHVLPLSPCESFALFLRKQTIKLPVLTKQSNLPISTYNILSLCTAAILNSSSHTAIYLLI